MIGVSRSTPASLLNSAAVIAQMTNTAVKA